MQVEYTAITKESSLRGGGCRVVKFQLDGKEYEWSSDFGFSVNGKQVELGLWAFNTLLALVRRRLPVEAPVRQDDDGFFVHFSTKTRKGRVSRWMIRLWEGEAFPEREAKLKVVRKGEWVSRA